jgi:hypothetical protein
MGIDDVCVVENVSTTCVAGFNFFIITSQSGLDDLDGILGLSPPVSGNGPSFYYNLMQQDAALGP